MNSLLEGLVNNNHDEFSLQSHTMQSYQAENHKSAHCPECIGLNFRGRTNLMSCVADHSALFGERLKRMPGDEPGSFDVILVEKP